MRNKNETEPDMDYESKWKKVLDQNVENLKMDSDADISSHGKKVSDQNLDYLKMDSDAHGKKNCDQEVDNPQTAPDQEMDLGQGESQRKVDLYVPSESTQSQKMECTTTHTD